MERAVDAGEVGQIIRRQPVALAEAAFAIQAELGCQGGAEGSGGVV
jgi:hypothetical protein